MVIVASIVQRIPLSCIYAYNRPGTALQVPRQGPGAG